MTSPELSDRTAGAEALMCRSAVALMRARRRAVPGGDIPPEVDRLLSVVLLELATAPDSVPPTIRDAAVQLAAHLVQRYAIPVPREAIDRDEPPEHAGAAGRGTVRADGRTAVPFAPSVRLGRMG